MITLTSGEVVRLLANMREMDVRQIAVMDKPSDIEFAEESTGEHFAPETIAHIWNSARLSQFRCPYCHEYKLAIDGWTRDSHNLDMCQECFDEAELEDAHSDGYHDAERDPDCPACRAESDTPRAVFPPKT